MQFPNDNQSSEQPRQTPSNPEPEWRKWLSPGVLLLVMLLVLFSSQSLLSGIGQLTEVDYSVVRDEVIADNVVDLEFEGNNNAGSVSGEFSRGVAVTLADERKVTVTHFVSNLPPGGGEDLTALATEHRIPISSVPNEIPLLQTILFQFGPFLLIIVFFIWMSRRAQGQMGNIFSFGRSQAREYDAQTPRVTFSDVAGQEAPKQELTEVVDFLKEPEKYIALGARVPRGVLLIGPPGTGKTLMARAVAGEANVAFYSITASEFMEMFVGVGASRVRDLFNRAKSTGPSIIFIDELDAIGRRRGTGLGGGHDEREQTLNQLLAEMDGFDQTADVIVMAATNRPDVLDPALLRPGRFDRQVTVGLPDRKGRLEILKIHTRGKPLGQDVDLEKMSKSSIGFSGADIANLANEAALIAARNDRKAIQMGDFSQAFERIILGTERPPLSNAEERKTVAFHESGHALVSILLPEADPILKVTIIPRGQALGVTVHAPENDRLNYSRRYLESQLRVLLGGRAAEEIVIGDITTGASNDLRRVTDLARRMVVQFGMSKEIGQLNFGETDQQPFLGYSISQGRNYSEETAAKIDVEVRRIVDAAYQETVQLLTDNRDKLELLTSELLEHETLEATQVHELLGIPEKTTAEDVEPVPVADVEGVG